MSNLRDTPPTSSPLTTGIRTVLVWIAIALTVALGQIAAFGQTDSEGSPSDDSTLTWSVRPTPADADPERPNFVYDLEPGDTVEDSIRIRNYTTDSLVLDIYSSDAITTASGALDLLPADQEPSDVGTWVTLDTSTIEVSPQSHLDVPFTLTVPESAEPGDHSGGIVTSFRVSGTESGQEVVVDHRLGSRMHVRVDGPLQPSLEIGEVVVSYDSSLNPTGSGSAHATYVVTNTGNVRAGVEQVISTPDWLGVFGREATPDAMGELLPGNSLQVAVEVDGVWPTLRTTAQIEATPVPVRDGDVFDPTTPTATASATVWSVPWPQLATLLLLVAGVLGVRWSRGRRRQREATMVDEAVKAALATSDTGGDPEDITGP